MLIFLFFNWQFRIEAVKAAEKSFIDFDKYHSGAQGLITVNSMF